MKAIKKLLDTTTKKIVAIVLLLILITWIILLFASPDLALSLVRPLLWTLLLVAVSWIAIHYGVKAWRKRKRGEFDEAVAAKEGIEDRRREWSTWTEELEKQGIDRYELPFYLLVGEPQSGKSVLLHNSDLHFPFGQNRLSGVGGTRGCDWWFTEEAVILDLAGRLFTHEGGATDRLEFESFLKLLHEFRPLCPANGIILVIPCDSLLKDEEDVCALKATKIQNALLTVTTQLEAQLPVYLVLTKGDQIFGFAESVHRLDVERRHQMFGWSRPAEKMDSPFDITEVTQGFDELIRRSRMLRAHMCAGARLPEALPEVDRMFAFPHELAGMKENLEAYIKRIFTASNLTDRVFFRGLYLTSGLQTGVPIAKVCTELFGQAGEADNRDLQALFNKQRAYFIKDLMRNRVFGERGLVRPTQGRVQQTRRSSMIAFGLSGLLVAASLIFAVVYMLKDVGDAREMKYEQALTSGQTAMEAELNVTELLAALQRISDAAKVVPDDLEKMHFDPSDEFKQVYCKVFDARLLPTVKRLALEDMDKRLDPAKGGLQSYDEMMLVGNVLKDFLTPEVNFASKDLEKSVTELLGTNAYSSKVTTNPDELPLTLETAFNLRRNYGDTQGLLLLPAEATRAADQRLVLSCATRLVSEVESCTSPGSKVQPRGELGYMLAWQSAIKAREKILADNILDAGQALKSCRAFWDATQRMLRLQDEIPTSGEGRALKYKEVLVPIKQLSATLRNPLAEYVAKANNRIGDLDPWPSLGDALNFADSEFKKYVSGDGWLTKSGINFGGKDAQITLFQASESMLSLATSEIILNVQVTPLKDLDQPSRLIEFCGQTLLEPNELKPSPFAGLGREIYKVNEGVLEPVSVDSQQFRAFHAQLIEVAVIFLAELRSTREAREALVGPIAPGTEEHLSREFVEELRDLHVVLKSLIKDRKINSHKDKLEEWLVHLEKLLFNHLTEAENSINKWRPTIPEKGDFATASWAILETLGKVANREEFSQQNSSSRVIPTASQLQRKLFMRLADQLLERWNARKMDKVSETRATVEELKAVVDNVRVILKSPDSLSAGGELASWGNLVDEMLSVRLKRLQDDAVKIWNPGVLGSTLELAVANSRAQMNTIQGKITASEELGLPGIREIVSLLDGVEMKGLKLEKTADAIKSLAAWEIPRLAQSVTGHKEWIALSGTLDSLPNLGTGKGKGVTLAEIYRQNFHQVSADGATGLNAGILMARQIRTDLGQEIKREIREIFLKELEGKLASTSYAQLFNALFWNPENESFTYDDKDVSAGLDRFFDPKDGALFDLRKEFLFVDRDGNDVIGDAIFPPGAKEEGKWPLYYRFLSEFQRFLLKGESKEVGEVKIDFWITPLMSEPTVWKPADRGYFFYPEDNSRDGLQRKAILPDMDKAKVSDWGFQTTRKSRSMLLVWSEKPGSDEARRDEHNLRLDIPSCLAPMLLAWQGKPKDPDLPLEYIVKLTPKGLDAQLEAPMTIEFTDPLPVRPNRKP